MYLVAWPPLYYPMNSSDVSCIDVTVGVFVAVAADAGDALVVELLSMLCVAIFRIHFDDAAALNIDVPSNVDGFDAAIALVRAATNIVLLGVDYMMTTVTMMMTASPQTTFDYGNSIEQSAEKWEKEEWNKHIRLLNIHINNKNIVMKAKKNMQLN